jgi:chemotaxis protein CheC
MKDEMDILREVGSISAAHGSIALSEILDREIKLHIPSLDIMHGEAVLSKVTLDQIVISVSSHMLTELKGNVLFVLDEKSAFKLVDMHYKPDKEKEKKGLLTEMGMSIIKETGSVVISSYVGALSIMLKKLIIPSIPTLVSGPIQEIISFAITPYGAEDYVLLIEAVFEEPKQGIRGSFYLVLSPQTMKYIQDACRELLRSLKEKSE